jgi:two-component system, OmpR family, sensor histidine kinase VicK
MLTQTWLTLGMITNNQGNNTERTEILYESENIINIVLQCFPNAYKTVDSCYDPFVLSEVISNKRLMNAAQDFVHRSGKIRVVTEITNDNIAACKEMMKIADIGHLEGIRRTFAVSEKEYFGHVDGEPNRQHSQAIYSNVANYVRSQQYLFETLWKKAIPSKHKIREIEEEAKWEVVEIIPEPVEIQKISYELVESAEKEILIVFSTANAFQHQIKEDKMFLQLLKEKAASKLVDVRILVPIEQKTINEMALQLKSHGIVVGDYKKRPQVAPLITFVVDHARSLAVELQYDTNETSEEPIELATYSNSESTALSYISKFETSWLQKEIHYRDQRQQQDNKKIIISNEKDA